MTRLGQKHLYLVPLFLGLATACDKSDTETRLELLEMTNDYLRERITNLENEIEASRDVIAAAREIVKVVRADETNVYIEGANLHVRNRGHGPDGLGNILVGRQSNDEYFDGQRGGSHNVVIGGQHQYNGSAGLIAGDGNALLANYAVVLGGYHNRVLEKGGVVIGGEANGVDGENAVVVGGTLNQGDGYGSVVVAGESNTTDEFFEIAGGGPLRQPIEPPEDEEEEVVVVE